MRRSAITFLFLALSLPALAHHHRDDDRGRPWHHRRVVVESCGPRWGDPDWRVRPRVVYREARPWCEPEREVVYLPPPPPPSVIVRPRVRLWIGF